MDIFSTPTDDDSPVVKFVKLAWAYAGGTPHSWEAYNHQVHDVCHIAAAGFEWREGDADAVLSISNRRCTIHRCLCENGVEYLYATAVQATNPSACHEFERYFGRKPVIADNVTHDRCRYLHRQSERKRDRLCLRSVFPWDGKKVVVTSFDKDGKAVCVPKEGKRKLYRIGPDEIKAERKRLKSEKAAKESA